ncbi:MAG: ornithine carbamoyltransferase [Proteobacteria bacterium]|jgi:ornithine carbamoyltransferase|nr:ornithine carbamoyltransferase [Pseudomonadota bacterium]
MQGDGTVSQQVLSDGLMPVKLRERRLVRLRQLSMLTHTHPRLFMGSARTPRHAPAPASLPPGDERALLEQARSLQRASAAGRVQPLLRGKNLGLLCADDTQAQALLFRQAASELGAHVAHIGMSLSECSAAQEVTHTARMLGRLYDAVECQGLPTAMVQQMAEVSGIAVYDGLASNERLISRLAAQLGDEASAGENRRFVLQALLLHTIV